MITTRLLEALQIQESVEGPSENIDLLKRIAKHIRYSDEWKAFTNSKFHRYGKMSYECHHFYYIKEHLKALLVPPNSLIYFKEAQDGTET